VYVCKGGKAEDTIGRNCLCNALVANIGHPQVRGGKYVERGLVTSGDGLLEIPSFLAPNRTVYNAVDVIAKLLGA
jgi:nitronate monooxygenase